MTNNEETNNEVTKIWISESISRNSIQQGWTQKQFLDFLIDRKIIQSADQYEIVLFPNEVRFRCKETEYDGGLVYNELQVSEDFIQPLVNEFYKMMEEYAHEERLFLQEESMTRDQDKKAD